MQFRQVTRQELAAPYRVAWNAEYPEDLRSNDEVLSSYILLTADAFEEHWILDAEPAVVTAFDMNSTNPVDNLTIEVVVDPAAEHVVPEGLALADDIVNRVKPNSVSVWTNDMRPERMKLIEDHGYHLVQTVPMTRLDLPTFDAAPFEARRNAVAGAGIRLTTVDRLEAEGFDWITSLYHAAWEMVQDMPRTHEPVQPTIEQYREMLKNPSVYVKDLMFVAVADGKIVAYSRVTPAETMPHLARTGLSGTVRDYRRKGVITALKVMAIETMRDRGYTLLQTDNDARNPMYRLNLELGFTDRWNWLQYEKKC